MAIRTTGLAVAKTIDRDGSKGVLDAYNDGELDFDPDIEIASLLVDDVCTNSDYSDERLEHIERLLAAHFNRLAFPDAKQEAAKGLTVTYEGQTKLGLDFTRYGQQAKVLDIKGNLAAIDVSTSGSGKLKGRVDYVGGCGDK